MSEALNLTEITNEEKLVANGTEKAYVDPKFVETRADGVEFAEIEKSLAGVVVGPTLDETAIVQTTGVPTRAKP